MAPLPLRPSSDVLPVVELIRMPPDFTAASRPERGRSTPTLLLAIALMVGVAVGGTAIYALTINHQTCQGCVINNNF